MRPIEKLWRSYLLDVVPKNAAEIQIRETRRAFYAGAAALFNSIMGGLDGGTPSETRADMVMMDAIYRELKDFPRLVAEGKD